MCPKATLFDMPDDVMRKICGKLDIVDILNLRKTSHALRDFIIEIQPNSEIYEININIDLDKITFHLNFDEDPQKYLWGDGKNYKITYENVKNDCKTSWRLKSYHEKKCKIFKNSNILDIFSGDFGVILSHQKSFLRNFHLIFNYPNGKEKRDYFKIFNHFKTHFDAEKRNLKLESLKICVRNEREILEILPYCSPEHLKILKIDVGKRHGRLELQEIIFLDQWTGLKEAELIGCCAHARHFLDFEKIDFSIQTITTQDVFEFKEILFQSTTLHHIQFNFQHYYTDQDLVQNFGPPSVATDEWGQNPWKIWYLRIPDRDQVLKMEYHTCPRIFLAFSRMEMRDVPGNVNVVVD